MLKKLHSNLIEGLEQGDLRRLIAPEVHVDEYKSKMGSDEDIIVTSFRVTGREPAKDLVNFIEKGYDWVLDADISSGELSNGDFIVFVESDRNSKYPKDLIDLVNDILNLTEHKLTEWKILFRSFHDPLDLTIENIRNNVPLSSEEYLRKFGSKSLDEMRTAAGVDVTTKAPKNDYTQSLRSLAGIL
jgi:hypothetical protein